MTRRVVTIGLTLLLAAAGCSGDDEPVESQPTVPSTNGEPDPSAPVSASPTSTESPSSTDAPAEETVAPDGDLGEVEIGVTVLVTLVEPIDSVVAPNGEWWIAQRTGEVLVVDPSTGEVGDTVLDISADTVAGGERGLLGMAIDEEFLYLDYTDPDGDSHVDAARLDGETGRPDPLRIPLLTQDQPFGNHNGGGLAIGPDGDLYIGFGDGGLANDPLGAGQDTGTWLGAILRIDPSPDAQDRPYEIPTDNPYADGGGEPEIFLIGARNPWRFSFDSQTDDLWVADVGQDLVEEVNHLPGADGWGLGANLGWNLREGTIELAGPRPEGNIDPVYEYQHGGRPDGCSVSGGHVYRGAAIPDLVGTYVFGDFCTAELWAVSIAGGDATFRDLGVEVPGGNLVGFGIDPDGELVTLSLDGPVARIIPG